MSDGPATERSICVNAVRGEGDDQWLYYSDQTGRWARVIARDAPGSPRPPSFEVVLSSRDGLAMGGGMAGEVSPYFAVRYACNWVKEGR